VRFFLQVVLKQNYTIGQLNQLMSSSKSLKHGDIDGPLKMKLQSTFGFFENWKNFYFILDKTVLTQVMILNFEISSFQVKKERKLPNLI
jgi:hypothetical protein